MKKYLHHLKTSGIMTGSGMASYAGGQLVSNSIGDSFWKTVALFAYMTVSGVILKLVLEHMASKGKKDETKVKEKS